LGLEPLGAKRLEACEVFLERHQLGLVLRLLRLGLIERCLEQPRVDLGQYVTFLDALAFLEEDVLKLAVHLRMNADREGRLDRAEPGEMDRYVTTGGCRDGNGDCRWLAARCFGGYDTTSQQVRADSDCNRQQASRYNQIAWTPKAPSAGGEGNHGRHILCGCALNPALWVRPPFRDIAGG